ncbi:hypothetical protein [Paraburkholderia saeva]|uniref:Uncharacterized protein n=1 Tax=Paraburkholderia saeva TaxID=2777537 RepID=A0A9N8RZH8_9BURK|nr:hypothetical protein [Paraburkholderia saeva]CAG4889441.1 hypothetical protein R52603_00957 [Paraburkholderia saeva]CAG4894716.1 hypothetical protein R70241_01844 [Paraburkholderia saeva]CAG4918011.1 hypothetical protein LMG31841_04742 [Paraburkholderia saeva]
MKIRNVVIASLLCTASALAIAQGNGGGTGGGATGQPAADGGNNNPAAVAQGSSGSVAPMKHTSKKQHSTKTKKPMSDSTMPAANASSATQGQ